MWINHCLVLVVEGSPPMLIVCSNSTEYIILFWGEWNKIFWYENFIFSFDHQDPILFTV